MTHSPNMPKSVVIVGNDVDAWLTACTLLRAFGRNDISVTVVETKPNLAAQDVCVALADLRNFHRLLALPEASVLQASAGTLAMGQRFAGFSGKSAFMHAYGATGPTHMRLGQVGFIQHWVRARQLGLNTEYEAFNLTAVAAQNGRIMPAGRSVAGALPSEYGYHMMAAGYVALLKAVALKRGAVVHGGHHFSLTHNDDGGISAVIAGDGTAITGDLFFDATGPEARLISALEASGVESWGHLYPCNRLLTTTVKPFRPLPLYAQISANRHGWLAMYPQQTQTTLQMAYDGAALNDGDALHAAAALSGHNPVAGAVVRDLTHGMRPRSWVKNCVAVGEAAVRFDPLDGAPLQAMQLALTHLVSLYPVSTDFAVERDIYNEVVADHYERLRDFQLVRYVRNRRHDDPLWDKARRVPVPEKLAYKLSVFEARGLAVQYNHESFNADSWQSLMIGHGLMPKSYDPQIDQISEAEAIKGFQGHLAAIKQQVGIMATHEEALMAAMQVTPA